MIGSFNVVALLRQLDVLKNTSVALNWLLVSHHERPAVFWCFGLYLYVKPLESWMFVWPLAALLPLFVGCFSYRFNRLGGKQRVIMTDRNNLAEKRQC